MAAMATDQEMLFATSSMLVRPPDFSIDSYLFLLHLPADFPPIQSFLLVLGFVPTAPRTF